jgi:valyl-tRNA synthetase
MHPFIPFITEEIWQLLDKRMDGESIMISPLPKFEKFDLDELAWYENTKEVVTEIRKIRIENEIRNSTKLDLYIISKNYNDIFDPVLKKLGNLDKILFEYTKALPSNSQGFINNFGDYDIPLPKQIDIETEVSKLKEELKYNQGFLDSVMKKLGNERFVANAPAKVLEIEQKKKSDTERKIETLEDRLKSLKST